MYVPHLINIPSVHASFRWLFKRLTPKKHSRWEPPKWVGKEILPTYFGVTEPSPKMALNGSLIRCVYVSLLHVIGLQTLPNMPRPREKGRPRLFTAPLISSTPVALFVATVVSQVTAYVSELKKLSSHTGKYPLALRGTFHMKFCWTKMLAKGNCFFPFVFNWGSISMAELKYHFL